MASNRRRFAQERHPGLKLIAIGVSVAAFATTWGLFAATFDQSVAARPAGVAIAGAAAASATAPPVLAAGSAVAGSPVAPAPSAAAPTPTPTVISPSSGTARPGQVAPVQRRSRGS